jgi:hypothetical protein
MEAAGAKAMLVGESLMRQADVAAATMAFFTRRSAGLPGLRPRRELHHGFTLPLLVAHGDRHAVPHRRVAGPPGLAMKPPDIGLPIDLDL